jgi:release factor glutamine methyltransferase
VRTGEIDGLAPEVRDHDPRAALDGGPDGLGAYRAIAARAPGLLTQGGALLLEVGHDQADAVAALIRGAGLANVRFREDMSRVQRVVIASETMSGDGAEAAKKPLGKVP